MTACAMFAGRSEENVSELVQDLRELGRALEPLAKSMGR